MNNSTIHNQMQHQQQSRESRDNSGNVYSNRLSNLFHPSLVWTAVVATLMMFCSKILYAQVPTTPGYERGPDVGLPQDWQMHFQPSSSEVMDNIVTTHDLLLGFMIIVVVLVLGLMSYILVRFSAKNNPVPSTTSNHHGLEIIWTVIPAICLAVLGFVTLPYILYESNVPKGDVTIKVSGSQWYWSYEYVDEEDLAFDSILVAEDAASTGKGQHRLLSVDNELVVPIDSDIVLQITAEDVLHAFALPALGIKRDAVPGRLNQAWFRANRIGVYYGQCSELCGGLHAYMPIVLRVVSKREYSDWLKHAKKLHASVESIPANTISDTSPTVLAKAIIR